MEKKFFLFLFIFISVLVTLSNGLDMAEIYDFPSTCDGGKPLSLEQLKRHLQTSHHPPSSDLQPDYKCIKFVQNDIGFRFVPAPVGTPGFTVLPSNSLCPCDGCVRVERCCLERSSHGRCLTIRDCKTEPGTVPNCLKPIACDEASGIPAELCVGIDRLPDFVDPEEDPGADPLENCYKIKPIHQGSQESGFRLLPTNGPGIVPEICINDDGTVNDLCIKFKRCCPHPQQPCFLPERCFGTDPSSSTAVGAQHPCFKIKKCEDKPPLVAQFTPLPSPLPVDCCVPNDSTVSFDCGAVPTQDGCNRISKFCKWIC